MRALGPVTSLGKKLFEPGLALRQSGPGDGTGQHDPVVVRYVVQDTDGGAIAQKDALGVNGD